jgi:hypothetical protein
MIVAAHLASGALAGAALGRRSLAALAGPALHLAGDATPHHDMPRALEVAAGAMALVAIALRAGPAGPAMAGALAAAAPDVEHLRVVERRLRRKLFPSHRIAGLHRDGGLPAWAQLAAAAVAIALLSRVSAARDGR